PQPPPNTPNRRLRPPPDTPNGAQPADPGAGCTEVSSDHADEQQHRPHNRVQVARRVSRWSGTGTGASSRVSGRVGAVPFRVSSGRVGAAPSAGCGRVGAVPFRVSVGWKARRMTGPVGYGAGVGSASAPEPVGRETAQTLDRGLQLLQVLGSPGAQAGLTVTELAERLGVGRTVVYRLVSTLAARDFVTRSADGRVRLGLAMTRLALAVRPVIIDLARPVLRRLAEQRGATAHLTVAEGDDALAVLVVEPSWTD